MTHRKKLYVCAAAAVFLILNACGGNAAEQAYTHLEEAASLENGFEEQQEPIMNLEEKEQQLYEDMLSLGTEDMEQIQSLATEAVGLAEERKQLLEQEKESIESAYEEYQLAVEQMNQVEQAREEAQAVKKAMENRYTSYQDLYESYQKAVEQDIELYHAFTNEDLEIEDLQNRIDTVNQQYSIVVENKDAFNSYTDEYNQAKQNFYEAAELDISDPESEEAENTE
ncbi:YkyA family protein [Salibacterium qingdaonense]|uniref:Putative cell-wall binding lipoprotein n=1 Tax=Salibacterium qingdaonense TaxID=266892 RepID=A0A1I4IS44_9BACI|nr:YkyA family protein [Salibacterium qingdaonense]SFL57114.1 Putative cell-wall binding lipoprotein [Salibacterium qingdaonense]